MYFNLIVSFLEIVFLIVLERRGSYWLVREFLRYYLY